MKKIAVIIFLASILLIVSSVYVVSYMNYNAVKQDNEVLLEKIEKINTENDNEENKSITLNENINKLQEDFKEEINEHNLWLKTKEKLSLALSS